MNILIVEDSNTCARILEARLRRHPHYAHVTIAPDLSAARVALRNHFDYVILDLELPDGSGLDVLPFVGNAAVIVVTARDVVPDAYRVVKKGPTWAAQVERTLREGV